MRVAYNGLHDLAQADAHHLPLDKSDIDMIALVEQAGELFEPLAEEAGLTLLRGRITADSEGPGHGRTVVFELKRMA